MGGDKFAFKRSGKHSIYFYIQATLSVQAKTPEVLKEKKKKSNRREKGETGFRLITAELQNVRGKRNLICSGHLLLIIVCLQKKI